MNLLILSFSLAISVIASFWIAKKKNSKLLGMASALVMNPLILIAAFSILYSRDVEARMFGIGTDYDVLIFSIPIVIWLNFMLLQFVRYQKEKA